MIATTSPAGCRVQGSGAGGRATAIRRTGTSWVSMSPSTSRSPSHSAIWLGWPAEAGRQWWLPFLIGGRMEGLRPPAQSALAVADGGRRKRGRQKVLGCPWCLPGLQVVGRCRGARSQGCNCCCEPRRAHATSCRETLRCKELPSTPRTTFDLGSLEWPGAVPRRWGTSSNPLASSGFVSAGSFHGHGWPSWPLNLMATPIYRRPHCRQTLALYNNSLPTDHASVSDQSAHPAAACCRHPAGAFFPPPFLLVAAQRGQDLQGQVWNGHVSLLLPASPFAPHRRT